MQWRYAFTINMEAEIINIRIWLPCRKMSVSHNTTLRNWDSNLSSSGSEYIWQSCENGGLYVFPKRCYPDIKRRWVTHQKPQISNLVNFIFGRSQWPRGLRCRSLQLVCWDCGFESHPGHGCLSVVSVVCCQVEVSATDWSFVQRSPIDCGASLCVIKKPRKRWG